MILKFDFEPLGDTETFRDNCQNKVRVLNGPGGGANSPVRPVGKPGTQFKTLYIFDKNECIKLQEATFQHGILTTPSYFIPFGGNIPSYITPVISFW